MPSASNRFLMRRKNSRRRRQSVGRVNLHHRPQRDGRIPQLFDAKHLRRLEKPGVPLRVLREGIDLALEHFDGEIDVGLVRHADVEHHLAEFLGEVRGNRDLPVRHVMNVAVEVPQHGGPQPDRLDSPAHSRDLHHVVDAILILGDDEQTGDDVLHQVLRTKANRYADN